MTGWEATSGIRHKKQDSRVGGPFLFTFDMWFCGLYFPLLPTVLLMAHQSLFLDEGHQQVVPCLVVRRLYGQSEGHESITLLFEKQPIRAAALIRAAAQDA